METIDSGRTKFERMRALQRENVLLTERNERQRRINIDLEYKIRRLEFRERWAMTAVGQLRQRVTYMLDSILAQTLAKVNGNKGPEYGFNVLMSQCGVCRGCGGKEISEDECEDLGLVYSEYTPKWHDPIGGYEYWCDACVGTGNTLSTNEYIGSSVR